MPDTYAEAVRRQIAAERRAGIVRCEDCGQKIPSTTPLRLCKDCAAFYFGPEA